MTMMFEVEDLSVASPATVSRCGMVYMEPEALGYQLLIDSWLKKLPENILTKSKIVFPRLKSLIDTLVAPVLVFMRKNVKEVVTTANNNLVQSFLRILDCYLVGFTDTETKKFTSEDLEVLEQSLESLFYFALVWSFGATGDYDSREKFNLCLTDLALMRHKDLVLPVDNNWYESFYDVPTRTFQLWNTKYVEFQVDQKLGYHEIMIPTADSTRNTYLLQLLIQNGKHVMNPGPTGTGKTQNIQNLLTR
jgi:dynein heavy chain